MRRATPIDRAFLAIAISWCFVAFAVAADRPAPQPPKVIAPKLQAPPLVLVHDGVSDYSIVLSAKASASETYGAGEIQYYLKQMSGATLPIVTDEQPAPEHAILVGYSAAVEALKPVVDWKALGDEGFVLRAVGGRMIVAGSPLRGTMYGCTTLLEKVGVRWYTPGVTVIPHLPTLAVPALDETQVPAFEYREPYFTEALDHDWAPRLKVNGNFANIGDDRGGRVIYYPFVHTFDLLVPPDLFAAHPEYFPKIGGKRKHGSVQRCLSNPDVLKLSIAKVQEWMKDHPEAKIYSVSQNDNHEFCECDKCQEIEEKYGGTHSGLYLWFANQVADAVARDHPDKLIDTLAYQFTEEAPKHISPRPNVRVRFCPIGACAVHPLEWCDFKDSHDSLDALKGWSHLTDNLYLWGYSTDFANYLQPFPNFNEFPADVRLYVQRGVRGVFFEGDYAQGGGGSDAEMRSYVMAKLLWNPAVDSNALVTEWMKGVYGKAWEPMRKWFDVLHHEVENPHDRHVKIYEKPTAWYLTQDVIRDGDRLFAEAATLAAGDATANLYVAKARLSLRYVKIARGNAPPGELDAFLADVRKFGIQQLAEGKSVDQWEKEVRKK